MSSSLTHKYKIWRLGNKSITYKKMGFNRTKYEAKRKSKRVEESYRSFMKMTIIVVVRQEKKNASLAKKLKNKKDICWIP